MPCFTNLLLLFTSKMPYALSAFSVTELSAWADLAFYSTLIIALPGVLILTIYTSQQSGG